MPRLLARGVVAAFAAAALLALAGRAPLLPVVAVGVVLILAIAVEAALARDAAPRGGREALLDTSVLIDGRIEPVVATGFSNRRLVVPEFVLRELQHVADSADPSRRTRGRRGLEVLAALRALPHAHLTVIDDDAPAETEVDRKLVAVARARGADLLTTDYNLNKVASVHGIRVLNLNELSHALRPVVLPGETLTLTIVKEGKEAGQGVGYLEDGTMVVVEQGRGAVGRTLPVVVTGGLQTAAGKMFFAKLPGGG